MTTTSPLSPASCRTPEDLSIRCDARILLFDPDPYLAFLVRLHLPEAHVTQVRSGSDARRLAATADLVILDLATAERVEEIRPLRTPKTIGIVDRVSGPVATTAVDAVIHRPFVPDEIVRIIRSTLAMADAADTTDPVRRARTWVGPGRLAAVAIGAATELAFFELTPVRAGVLVAVAVYTIVRLLHRGRGRFRVLTDVALAAVAVTLTGGTASPYTGFALLMCLEAGLVLGIASGSFAGVFVSAGSLPQVAAALGQSPSDTRELVVWLTLFPLAAAAGGLVTRMGRANSSDRAALLLEANRVLSTLYALARAIPDGLDRAAVTATTLEEARRTTDAEAAVLLAEEAGMLVVLGGFGLPADAPAAVATDDPEVAALLAGGPKTVERADVHGAVARLVASQQRWIAAPLVRSGAPTGLLLTACAGHDDHQANRIFCGQLAEEAAVALENAKLFARVREMSVDEERRRLARELHDGVAQSLTYVRMELEHHARRRAHDREAEAEARRLARVVDGALMDVRGSIHGLNASVDGTGLSGALRSYLANLGHSGGPEIVYRERGVVSLPASVQSELFRIAQEAVSNALRHAAPSVVTVILEDTGDGVRLTVTDDGRGFGLGARPGFGLHAMDERARRIGAVLSHVGRPHGGTRVELVRCGVRDHHEEAEA